tara:strand:- start:163 stop:672 length:510 start_codon:yes stop_codon:yes gene_type:complete
MRILALCSSLILATAAANAKSDDNESEAVADQATLLECIANNTSDEGTCIGVISMPCMEEPGGETTVGMVGCSNRELAAWDDLLNARYAQSMAFYSVTYEDADLADMQARQAERLREAQRAWIALRDADCTYESGMFEGGSLARVVTAGCRLDHTARRAIWLAPRPEGG